MCRAGKAVPDPQSPSTGDPCDRAGLNPEAAPLFPAAAPAGLSDRATLPAGTDCLCPSPACSPSPPAQGAPAAASLSPSPPPQPEVFCKHKCINKLARAPMNISCLTCPRFLPVNGSLPLCLSEQDTFSVEHKSRSPVRWRGNRSALGLNRPRSRRSGACPRVLGTLGFPSQLLFPSLSPFLLLFFSFLSEFCWLSLTPFAPGAGMQSRGTQSCCWEKLGLKE